MADHASLKEKKNTLTQFLAPPIQFFAFYEIGKALLLLCNADQFQFCYDKHIFSHKCITISFVLNIPRLLAVQRISRNDILKKCNERQSIVQN